jgi:hypothetical protein
MKYLRFSTALFIASAGLAAYAAAGDKTKDSKTAAACECAKDKEGKACGVDKDCCCTGKKAEKKPEEKKS